MTALRAAVSILLATLFLVLVQLASRTAPADAFQSSSSSSIRSRPHQHHAARCTRKSMPTRTRSSASRALPSQHFHNGSMDASSDHHHHLFSPSGRSSRRSLQPLLLLFMGAGADDNDTSAAGTPEDPEIIPVSTPVPSATRSSRQPNWTRRVRNYFRGGPPDGLSTKQRLAKMGLAVALSYGWVSNMSYCVSVSLAWYIFSKRTGLSPLAPGQWKGFLAVYSGFWVFNNVIRPLRATAAVAISPQLERIVETVQKRAKVSKGVAVFLTVFLLNVVGTTSLMCAGIGVAAILAGVPVFPPKP